MSGSKAEVIRQQIEAINRRDADAFVATVSQDVEWEDAGFWTEGKRTFRGKTELREWFVKIVVEPWESLRCEAVEITETDDERVLLEGRLTARGKGSGAETNLRFWAVGWVTENKLTKRQVFLDRVDALEAAGLRE